MADSTPPEERSEVGVDPLDAQVGPASLEVIELRSFLQRTRAALGFRPLVAPALFFVPLGAALGPGGLGLLPVSALGHLYPFIAVALAALGVFVGIGLQLDRGSTRRLLAFASLQALITTGVVAGVFLLLLAQWQLPLGPALPLAFLLASCAAVTAAGVAQPADPPTLHAAMRIADLDDVLPIVLGAIVLAGMMAQSGRGAAELLAVNILAAVAIAIAGWLLFERSDEPAERAVFVLGIIGLLGGSAMYLGASPLLSGLVAGVVWRHAPGHADAIIRDDLRRVQHPLVILLLIGAGALAAFSQITLLLATAYVLTRFSGKLLGGWVVSRLLPDISPADLGSYLLPPGVVGLGLALSVHVAAASAASATALAAVAIGTLVSELLGAVAVVGPRRP
jgi:hypothetical protein